MQYSVKKLIIASALPLIIGCTKQPPISAVADVPEVPQLSVYHKPLPTRVAATGEKHFVFDPQRLAWAAYSENGRKIKGGRASGGSTWCKDIGRPCKTQVGKFAVYRKGTEACKSSKYPKPKGGAPMPHCMFFKGGMAIHGSNSLPNRNASHGCVRVSKQDAKWLHENFLDIGTEVHVKPYFKRL